MISTPFPVLPNQDKFMPGDKVRELLPCGLVGDIFRVKARYAAGIEDYITLQNVDNRQEYTLHYWDVAGRLELVCHPATGIKFID